MRKASGVAGGLRQAASRREGGGKRSAHHRGGATESMEDYLECIANVMDDQGFVRASDVAERLDLRPASVSIMIKRLAELGYLNLVKYRGFTLTEQGDEVARRIRARHSTLAEFFELLGLHGGEVERDIEGIEHHVSPGTLRRLRAFISFWKSRPELAQAYRGHRESNRQAG